MDFINFFSIITIAFLGSFGHCIGMCGGIVVAYSSTKFRPKTTKKVIIFSHILYSLGRITLYTLFGMIFGFLGSIATFSNTASGILLIFAGLFMATSALALVGNIKFFTFLEHNIAQKAWYKEQFQRLLHLDSYGSFFTLGLLNGLLPCGFVYFFAITAAATADWFWGGVVMFIFGLSTIPALFGLGYFIGLFAQKNSRNTMLTIAAIVVAIYAIFTIVHGIDYLIDPAKKVMGCHNG